MTKTYSRKARIAAATVGAAAVAASSVFGIASPASATVAAVVISKLSVTTGSTTSATNVLITGKGFTGLVTTDITNLGTIATATVLNDTQLAIVVPTAHAAGKVDVSIANAASGAAANSNTSADDFTFIAPLGAMTTAGTGVKLNPLGGTVVPVTLSGGGFGSTSSLFVSNKITATVGGAKATVAWVSDTVINVTAPAGTPSSTVTAIVVSKNGVPTTVTANGQKYAAVISKLSVTSGPVAGGTSVTVTGKGLLAAGSINFGYDASGAASISLLNAATCTIVSDVSATCTSPVGPNDGSVALASGNAASALRGAVSVIVVPAAGIGTTNYLALPGAAFTYND
jgi:hypothetical protein